MRIVPFRPEHVDMLGTPRVAGVLRPDNWTDIICRLARMSRTFTLEHRGVALGCGGVMSVWDGVGEAWVVVGEEARIGTINGLVLLRAYRRMLDMIIKVEKLHRVQAMSLVDDGVDERFYRVLGFTNPALLRQYTADKKDCLLYERITP